MAKAKIVIDCDPGHDDLVAILFAAKQLIATYREKDVPLWINY